VDVINQQSKEVVMKKTLCTIVCLLIIIGGGSIAIAQQANQPPISAEDLLTQISKVEEGIRQLEGQLENVKLQREQLRGAYQYAVAIENFAKSQEEGDSDKKAAKKKKDKKDK